MGPALQIPSLLTRPLEGLRERIVSSATSPFAHAAYPLEHSLDYRGDPGLLGPGSVSWLVLADVATFVGGIRALLLQAAHPEVVAGVGDHSRYREDPLGRLSRTSAYVTATTYGAMPEVEAAVAQVRRIHRVVSGVSSRGLPYDAGDPGYSAWVHNALTESFLVAHQTYGEFKLSSAERDLFVVEQTRVGALLGSDPMPTSADELSAWIGLHPDLAPVARDGRSRAVPERPAARPRSQTGIQGPPGSGGGDPAPATVGDPRAHQDPGRGECGSGGGQRSPLGPRLLAVVETGADPSRVTDT